MQTLLPLARIVSVCLPVFFPEHSELIAKLDYDSAMTIVVIMASSAQTPDNNNTGCPQRLPVAAAASAGEGGGHSVVSGTTRVHFA